MKIVFIILLVAVGALMIYEVVSLVRAIIKRRQVLKSKQSNKTKGDK